MNAQQLGSKQNPTPHWVVGVDVGMGMGEAQGEVVGFTAGIDQIDH